MSIKQQRKSLEAVTWSPCLELEHANSINIAALQEIWVRTFDPLLKRYSSRTAKPYKGKKEN